MKIIKRGTPKDQNIWIGLCRECKSEAEATENELTHIQEDQRDGGRCSWEQCPVCKCGGANGYGGMIFYPKDNNFA